MKTAAVLLIGLYIFLGIYCMYQWGILLPWEQLVYVLAIIMAGAILNTRASLVAFGIISLNIAVYYLLEIHKIVHPDLSWSHELSEFSDPIILIIFFGIIALTSWVSNREIEKSLHRARNSEEALRKERDLLEQKVEERTSELQESQAEKLSQLYRFAEFGKITSGILHDLVSPLSVVSLNLEKMSTTEQSKVLRRAIEGTKCMEQFIEDARRHIRQQPTQKLFSLQSELETTLASLQTHASQEKVTLKFSENSDVHIYGNPIRFQQLISNLVGNAIDSYSGLKDRKIILINLEQTDSFIYIRIQDFGSGIPEKDKENIFKPFFTTKSPKKGTGIGLLICQEIVEKDFSGTLTVISEEDKGSVFSVKIPHDN